MEDMERRIEASGNEKLQKLFSQQKEKLETGELAIEILDQEESERPNVDFYFPQTLVFTPVITIKPQLVDIYPEKPYLLEGALIYGLAHSYCYSTQRDLYRQKSQNALQNYLFEMDATYILALYLQEVLAAENREMSPFQAFILESHQQDNLDTFSRRIIGYNMKQIYFYLNQSDNLPFDEFLEKLNKEADQIIRDTNFQEETEAPKRYYLLTVMKGFSHLSPRIIMRADPEKDGYQFSEKFPDLTRKIAIMEERLKKHQSFITEFNNRFYGTLQEAPASGEEK